MLLACSKPMSGCSKNLDCQRANTRTSESTMPAPSSTVLKTSNQNYKAMLTTELLDTANIVDVPCRLIHTLRLPDEQRHRRGHDLCSARRWAWYCKDPACPKCWSAWSCKSNFWLHLYETAVHYADIRTYTRVGRRDLAREWRVKTD